MDPFRVTLASVAGAALLGAIFVGAYAFVAVRDYTPPDGLHSAQASMPAAQEAVHAAFNAESPAYLNDGMRMTMRTYGPGEILISDAEAAFDPASEDHLVQFTMDIPKMAEAYGFDLEDASAEETDELALEGFGDLANGTIRFLFGKKGEIHVMDFLGYQATWRDHSAAESDFRLTTSQDPVSADEELQMPALMESVELFMQEDPDLVDATIAESSWGGVPTWAVETHFVNETTTGEAVIHLRQSDLAPLHLDMRLEGLFDAATIEMLRDMDSEFPLDDMPMRMVFDFEYGAVDITLPRIDHRWGVQVESETEWNADEYIVLIGEEQDHTVPLAELEAHVIIEGTVIDWDELDFTGATEVDVKEVLAVHGLQEGLEGSDGGYTFHYDDADGDGMLSAGDSLRVTAEAGFWENTTQKVSVLFYDKWAGNYQDTPAPGILWLLAALGGVIATRRAVRRRA